MHGPLNLSSSAAAGVGVGVSCTALAVLSMVFVFYMRQCRGRRHSAGGQPNRFTGQSRSSDFFR